MDSFSYASDRKFHLWGALVSDNHLLLRSPKISFKNGRNIDIVCNGVDYIRIGTLFKGISIRVTDPGPDADPIIRQFLSYPELGISN